MQTVSLKVLSSQQGHYVARTLASLLDIVKDIRMNMHNFCSPGVHDNKGSKRLLTATYTM